MPLTRDFHETLMEHLADREYRGYHVAGLIEELIDGEYRVGKRMLRDYVNATIGFDALSKALGAPAKSLVRMLSDSGNPKADMLFAILHHTRVADGFDIQVVANERAKKKKARKRVRREKARKTHSRRSVGAGNPRPAALR